MVHATDGHGIAKDTAAMWQQPHHGTSAHFVIGQDGSIIQSVSVADVAYHAHNANKLSVGIEHCARTPGELSKSDPGLPPSLIQLAASAKLTAWLCRRAGIAVTRANILGHAEADNLTTHTRCPTGAGIDLDEYVQLVMAAM